MLSQEPSRLQLSQLLLSQVPSRRRLRLRPPSKRHLPQATQKLRVPQVRVRATTRSHLLRACHVPVVRVRVHRAQPRHVQVDSHAVADQGTTPLLPLRACHVRVNAQTVVSAPTVTRDQPAVTVKTKAHQLPSVPVAHVRVHLVQVHRVQAQVVHVQTQA